MNAETRQSPRNVETLRTISLIAVTAGALGSVALMLYAGRTAPPLLLVLFALWVSSPFDALALCHAISSRWPAPMRTALYGATLVLAPVTLVIYAIATFGTHASRPTPVFVMVAPVSWVLIAVTIAAAAAASRSSWPAA